MINNSKALVTGGAGFIGSHLIIALLNLGWDVTVIDDMSNGLQTNLDLFQGRATIVKASILDQDALNQAAKNCSTIFHLAAVSNVAQTLTEPLAAHAVNATGTMNVLQAARQNNAHIVFSSSAATYGDTEVIPTPENSPQKPISMYGSQKLLGEHYIQNYCRLFDLTGVCLRYFNVYGPRQRPDSPYSGVISIFTDRAKRDAPISIHGTGEQTRDFIAVQDVVAANIAAANARTLKGDPFNICTGSKTSVKTLADLVVKFTNSKSEISHGPGREGDILHSLGVTDAAEKILGFRAKTPFEQGLQTLLSSD
jgi:UDP-glucose 4-epimerase